MNRKIVICSCSDCPFRYDYMHFAYDEVLERYCIHPKNGDPDGMFLEEVETIPDFCQLEKE